MRTENALEKVKYNMKRLMIDEDVFKTGAKTSNATSAYNLVEFDKKWYHSSFEDLSKMTDYERFCYFVFNNDDPRAKVDKVKEIRRLYYNKNKFDEDATIDKDWFIKNIFLEHNPTWEPSKKGIFEK